MAAHTKSEEPAREPATASSGGDQTDRLEAVKLRAATSTSLLTLTVTTGAAGVALIAFATSLHRVPAPAIVLWVLGGVALFVSAICGGLAIRRVSARGAGGTWDLADPRSFWRVQVWAFAIGAVLIGSGSVVTFGGPARGTPERAQDRRIGALASEVRRTRAAEARLQRQVRRLRRVVRTRDRQSRTR